MQAAHGVSTARLLWLLAPRASHLHYFIDQAEKLVGAAMHPNHAACSASIQLWYPRHHHAPACLSALLAQWLHTESPVPVCRVCVCFS